jgi:hypothetical protein
LNRRCLEVESHPTNVALIKSELAKIRIAVSSPLELYLLESWLLDWAHGYYLKWRGSTLEESTVAEFNRNYQQWSRMRQGEYVLPYDFEKFDHQIRKQELKYIVGIGNDVARTRYTGDNRQEFEKACTIVQNSIEFATLSDPPSHGQGTYGVKDCLLSGMRSTSIVGNAFNLLSFKMAEDVLKDVVAISPDLYTVEVRGDDLRLTSNNIRILLIPSLRWLKDFTQRSNAAIQED